MSEVVKVCKFNKLGIDEVRKLLTKIREDNDLHSDEAKDLLLNRAFTEKIEDAPEVDLSKTFSSKMDMINYFTPILTDEILDIFRKDAGFWLSCCLPT